MDMNIKTILLLFLLLIPFAGCDDDNEQFADYTGTWVNERNDTFTFDYSSGLVLFEDASGSDLYTYFLKGDSITLFPGTSSNTNDWKTYLLECNEISFVIHGFQGIEDNMFVKKIGK